jgi:NAD(P)-dependent dehydrogenase (short-subunit alcohol dehydrogenase family)
VLAKGKEVSVKAKPLSGQVALVTGAGKRIGRSIALQLAEDGANVAIHFRRSRAEAEEVAAKIAQMGNRSVLLEGDITKAADARRIVGEAAEEFGRLDILVNNAATFFAAPLLEMTEAQWDEMLATNLKAQFVCAQAAARIMKPQGSGHIINISSIGGLLAWPAYTHYCVAKAGVIMLTRCLARGLGPEVLVNSVAPGTIQFEGEIPDEDYIRRVPLHRMGAGEDIAGAISFLAQSKFITGQVLVVDGGRTLV